MDTPWGDVPVCDAHVHFFSRHFFTVLAEQKKVEVDTLGPVLGWQIPEAEPAHLADQWVQELNRAGVHRVALMASVPGDHASVIAAVARHPQRFRSYVMVNPLSPDSEAQVKAALESGHVRGLAFFPAMHRYSIYDDRATALLDLAAARPGTVAFVHCGGLSVGVRKKLGLPSYFDLRYSNPIDLHGVALRYPGIRFVIPHFGAGYLREMLMTCDLCPNVYVDTSSSNSWMKFEEADLDLRTVFRRTLDILGPRRLLFGTDSSFFPRGWHTEIFQVQAKTLYELGLKEETARMILHDNFVNLFG